MARHSSKTVYTDERKYLFASLALLCVVFGAYVYFVSAAVAHVVVRKEINQDIVELNSYISQLESQYIEAQHAMSNDMATQAGFSDIQNKIFVSKTAGTLVLSVENES